MTSARLILPTFLLTLAVSCGGDDSSAGTTEDGDTSSSTTDPAPFCAVGEVQACTCTDGQPGEQMCVGTAFGPCTCAAGSSSSSSGETTNANSSSSSTGGESSSTGPGGPVCGDGVVEEPEQCDDGDRDDDNDCSNDCVVHCGLMWEDVFPAEGSSGLGLDGDGNILLVYGATDDDNTVFPSITAYGQDGRMVSAATATLGFSRGIPSPAVDGDGAVVFGPAQEDGEDAETPRLYSFDPAGAINWQVDLNPLLEFPQEGGAGQTLHANGVALDASGDILVSATLRVTDTDTDVWAAKFDRTTGALTWESTFTGPDVGEFSLDRGGPVAVGPGGELAIAGLIRRTFNQSDVTGLAFGAAGGDAVWDVAVLDDPGAPNYVNYSVAIAPDGSAKTGTSAIGVDVFTAFTDRWSVGVLEAGEVVTTITADDVDAGTEDEAAYRPNLAFTDDGLWIASAWSPTNKDAPDASVARFDDAGLQQCAYRFGDARARGGSRAPYDALALPDGSLVVVGINFEDSGWIARFRH